MAINGRNVALRQTSVQTSTQSPSESSLAVDGNSNSSFSQGTCTQTDITDTNPSWTLTLDSVKSVHRFVLYNRGDCCSYRLNNFKLETLDVNNTIMWTYRDTRGTMMVYTVSTSQRNDVFKIRISPVKQPTESFIVLTLCEVEVYGECAAGTWGLQCNGTCPKGCSNWCHQDTGQCPSCLGFSDPPLCKTECKVSKWGHNCINSCSTKCLQQICDRVTGLCEATCESLSPPSCPSDCTSGFYGQNCSFQCPPGCKDLTCSDHGYCVSCQSGYVGHFFEQRMDSKEMTFEAGIGVGIAVGVFVVTVIAVVIGVVCRTRMKRPQTRSRQTNENHRETKFQSYEGFKQDNEYQHSYQPTQTPSVLNTSSQSDSKPRQMAALYENATISEYKTIDEPECIPGWFGSGWFGSKCQYLCHCDFDDWCDFDGSCSTKCASGWFGTGCQYRNLVLISGLTLVTTPPMTIKWLTDNDDASCNVDSDLKSVTLSWNTLYPFTWLRVKVKDSSSKLQFTFKFNTTKSLTLLSCNPLTTVLDDTTVDYRCDVNDTIKELIVTGSGVKSLCSLYISGGMLDVEMTNSRIG
ncbi:hypothetical protein Btru_073012 [Bulinus truncatus]|nr:hypothetical protein Btru_073012 [Bulinus truncatus]